MNILSIDWDYFFPDNFEFDWQFKDNKFIYCELLWPIRWSNLSVFDNKVIAKDIYHPDPQLLNGFLDKLLINSNLQALVLSDTHSDIAVLIDNFPKSNVYNFDQHHDIYYGKPPVKETQLDCGNWASYYLNLNQIKSYHLFYPPWRESIPENQMQLSMANSMSYSIPKDPPVFDAVFICRSSPWTPSWSDHKWIKFIEYFKTNYPILWNHKTALEYVLKPRPFDQHEADLYEKQVKRTIEKLNRENKKLKGEK
jgi:hypothetical protein